MKIKAHGYYYTGQPIRRSEDRVTIDRNDLGEAIGLVAGIAMQARQGLIEVVITEVAPNVLRRFDEHTKRIEYLREQIEREIEPTAREPNAESRAALRDEARALLAHIDGMLVETGTRVLLRGDTMRAPGDLGDLDDVVFFTASDVVGVISDDDR